jgi:5-methylcytosine-specific restriction endonuclease McrA
MTVTWETVTWGTESGHVGADRTASPVDPDPDRAPRSGARTTEAPVLVLNATYEPLGVIAARRAVVLVLDARAETVECDAAAHIRGAGVTVPVPSVVRLLRYVRVPHRVVPLTRSLLRKRDGDRCQYCGRKGDSVDHVRPRSRGGEHTWDNVVWSCRRCNDRKADRTLGELGWTLATIPRAPSWEPASRHPAWDPWLELAGVSR